MVLALTGGYLYQVGGNGTGFDWRVVHPGWALSCTQSADEGPALSAGACEVHL